MVVDIRWARVRRYLDRLFELERQAQQCMSEGQIKHAERRLKEIKLIRSALTVLIRGLSGQEVPHWIPELREEPEGGSSDQKTNAPSQG